jgi:hypothetical protein
MCFKTVIRPYCFNGIVWPIDSPQDKKSAGNRSLKYVKCNEFICLHICLGLFIILYSHRGYFIWFGSSATNTRM